MTLPYKFPDSSTMYSPSLVFFKELIAGNIARMVEIAGGPQRLRPHVKTHKTREIAGMEIAAGITKHKCATLAEAEMLAQCGVRDILLAYPMVGPNCARFARLVKAFPQCRFSTTIDHAGAGKALADELVRAGQKAAFLLDVDVGQHRTGITPGQEAEKLYEQLARTPGLEAAGFHVYDGHNHQALFEERAAAVQQQFQPVLAMRDSLTKKGIPVPVIVVGGTPTFTVFAKMNVPGLECSPGTCVLHDNGYGSRFADLAGFTPAALLLTRVIGRPSANRVTFDLGYKAVASDPPAGKRLILPEIPEYEAVLQNEEHLVIETPLAERFKPGDVAYAIPTHICPTCAMHRRAYVVENGRLLGEWDIVGRDRVLTI